MPGNGLWESYLGMVPETHVAYVEVEHVEAIVEG